MRTYTCRYMYLYSKFQNHVQSVRDSDCSSCIQISLQYIVHLFPHRQFSLSLNSNNFFSKTMLPLKLSVVQKFMCSIVTNQLYNCKIYRHRYQGFNLNLSVIRITAEKSSTVTTQGNIIQTLGWSIFLLCNNLHLTEVRGFERRACKQIVEESRETPIGNDQSHYTAIITSELS